MILSRIRNIFNANANAALDKMENPDAMMDQYLRNLNEDYAQVKAETASVMAIVTGIERKIAKCNENINSMDAYSKAAVAAGNEEDAKRFLSEKMVYETELTELQGSLTVAKTNSIKMREMHKELGKNIDQVSAKKSLLKSKLTVAKTQETVNKTLSGFTKANDNVNQFNRLEDRINAQLDTSFALEELSENSDNEDIGTLKNKYSDAAKDAIIEKQLEALKKSKVS